MIDKQLDAIIDEYGVWLTDQERTFRVLLSEVFVLQNGEIKIVDERPPLPATTDTNLRAMATMTLYWILNSIGWRGTRRCHREGFWCEYVYPYGFVPEGGCPRHD